MEDWATNLAGESRDAEADPNVLRLVAPPKMYSLPPTFSGRRVPFGDVRIRITPAHGLAAAEPAVAAFQVARKVALRRMRAELADPAPHMPAAGRAYRLPSDTINPVGIGQRAWCPFVSNVSRIVGLRTQTRWTGSAAMCPGYYRSAQIDGLKTMDRAGAIDGRRDENTGGAARRSRPADPVGR